MTIAAAYLTSEGVVLGADSATVVNVVTPTGPPQTAQIFRHSQKVYEIGENSRFGLCTWGAGSIAGVSHRVIVARLSDYVDDETTVDKAAEKLVELVEEATPEGQSIQGVLGYFLGGYDATNREPACKQITFTGSTESKITDLEIGHARFSGAPQFFSRVFHGYDPQIPDYLASELKEHWDNIPENAAEIIRKKLDRAPIKSEGYRDLPIREAIDWIHSYLHLTVKAFKFQFGVPVCGGPIEVAFISADRKFRWVCHKPFDSAIKEEDN